MNAYSEVVSASRWEGEAPILEDDINESEKMWRDPSAHKLRLCIANWLVDESLKAEVVEVSLRPQPHP